MLLSIGSAVVCFYLILLWDLLLWNEASARKLVRMGFGPVVDICNQLLLPGYGIVAFLLFLCLTALNSPLQPCGLPQCSWPSKPWFSRSRWVCQNTNCFCRCVDMWLVRVQLPKLAQLACHELHDKRMEVPPYLALKCLSSLPHTGGLE